MTDVKWKLVPVEPTEEMLKANAGTSTCHPPSWNRAMWAAFLAAAPSPSPEALPASGAVDLLRECLDIMNGLAKDVDACGWLADDLHGPSICTRLRTQLCGCECDACSTGAQHASDCALHNGPALPSGPCDCGAALAKPASEPAGGGVRETVAAAILADVQDLPLLDRPTAGAVYCANSVEDTIIGPTKRRLALAKIAAVALAKIDEARKSIFKSYRHLAARDLALLNDAYDLIAALSSPASSSPAEWVKFGPSEDGIKAKAKRQARLEAEALPAGVDAERITHARFSQSCSYIAKNASAWAADCLTLPEKITEPMRASSVERFIEEMEKWIGFMKEDLRILRALSSAPAQEERS